MSKQPDFDVVLQKQMQGDERGPSARVGAAWRIIKRDTGHDTGGVNVVINVPVIMLPGWRLTLWPSRDKSESGGGSYGGNKPPPNTPAADEFGDDDIPFVRNATLYGDDLYPNRRDKEPWEL